jgi:integrase
VSRWYAAQDLAASTMQNYRRHIEEHLLPAFEDQAIADIRNTDISAWEKRERAVPYAASSVKTWRATLHLILADAVDEGLRDSNPATKRRGRGKRAGRSRNRGPEKVVTTALGILLLAERTAILSGRDDEFVAIVLMSYTGMRWAEIVGLETGFVRPNSVRMEWQLYELDTGELHRCPPKDDSYRDIDTPGFLGELLAGHIARTQPQPCKCHGLTYAFRGHGAANGAASRPGAKLVDVARRAGVSTGTVSNVLNSPDVVAEPTRRKVLEAITELGYVRNAAPGELAAHWRRSGFATWLFQPAATGWYPKRGRQEAHPVPLVAEPWPGVPVRGRGASQRAEAYWLPIAPGLTPHGLRHTHKTLMQRRGAAIDATFRVWREGGVAGAAGPGAAGRRSRRRSEHTGQVVRDRTVLRQMLGCCVHSRCIRVHDDAAKATKERSDEGRCHHRPVVTLTHSAWLVNRSLPVGKRGPRPSSWTNAWVTRMARFSPATTTSPALRS